MTMRHTRLLLGLFIAVLVTIGAGCTKQTTNTNTPANTNTATTNSAATTNTGTADPYAGQEQRTLQLNFKDFHVVFTGYPYVDKDYRPRLYNLIYIDTIYASDDMVNLTDPSGKWKDAYEFSTTENKIFMPIGRSAADKPIWQTMEVVAKADVMTLLGPCTGTSVTLTGTLTATSYTCGSTDATAQYAGSDPCFVPVDSQRGLLYRQYSADGSATGSMCEVLKNNYITSITITE